MLDYDDSVMGKFTVKVLSMEGKNTHSKLKTILCDSLEDSKFIVHLATRFNKGKFGNQVVTFDQLCMAVTTSLEKFPDISPELYNKWDRISDNPREIYSQLCDDILGWNETNVDELFFLRYTKVYNVHAFESVEPIED